MASSFEADKYRNGESVLEMDLSLPEYDLLFEYKKKWKPLLPTSYGWKS